MPTWCTRMCNEGSSSPAPPQTDQSTIPNVVFCRIVRVCRRSSLMWVIVNSGLLLPRTCVRSAAILPPDGGIS
jgi:hypothetical protein